MFIIKIKKMKNKLLIFSILIICTSSCNYLEYDESDFLEKDAVFSSFQYTRDFLTNIYSMFLPHLVRLVEMHYVLQHVTKLFMLTNCHLYIVSTMVPGVLLILWMIDGIMLGGYEL